MVCRPKLPTGEKKAPKFQAPLFYPTDDPEQLQRLLGQAFGSVQDDLAGLHAKVDTPPLTTPVTAVSGVVMAKAGDVLRLMPGPAGIQVLLPTARATNKGQDISIIVQGATGNVTVRAVEGKVQGVASVTLSGDGLRVFRSDGGDGTATGAGAWWIVGRNSADSTAAFVGASAGTQLLTSGILSFANSNGLSFGLNSGTLTASYARELGIVSHLGGNSQSAVTRLVFANASGVTWSAQTAASAVTMRASIAMNLSAGTLSANANSLEFDDLNGVSFGLNTIAGIGVVTASIARSIAAVSASVFGGSMSTGTLVFSNDTAFTGFTTAITVPNVIFSLAGANLAASAFAGFGDSLGPFAASELSFSNSNGITWGVFSSNPSGRGRVIAVTASVPQQIGLVSHIGGNVVSSVTRLAFSNASNVTWSLSTAANAATVIASVAAAGAGNVTFSAGTTSGGFASLVFSNSNGVSFGLNGSTITASTNVLRFTNAVSSVTNVTNFLLSDANGLSWLLSTVANGATLSASLASSQGSITVSGGASSVALTNLVFTNTNNVGFALSTAAGGGTIRAAASIQISAGTTNGAQSVLSFANSNGVTFGLNASTITASVAAAAAGGVALADAYGHTISNSTVLFDPGPNSTLSNVWSGGTLSQNVMFGLTGSTMTAQAHIRVSDDTAGSGFAATRFNFINSNGLRWGATTAVAATDRHINITGTVDYSAIAPNLLSWKNFDGGFGNPVVFVGSDNQSTDHIRVHPLIREGSPFPGNITANTWGMLISESVVTTIAFTKTVRGGLYTMANSTQLSLVNSFSYTIARGAEAGRSAFVTGNRYLTIPAASWSSSPVLSAGAQYWFAYGIASAGANVGSFMLQNLPAGAQANLWFGEFGVSMTAGSVQPGFWGAVSTTGIPVSIGATQILSGTNTTNGGRSNAYNSMPAIAIAGSVKLNYP